MQTQTYLILRWLAQRALEGRKIAEAIQTEAIPGDRGMLLTGPGVPETPRLRDQHQSEENDPGPVPQGHGSRGIGAEIRRTSGNGRGFFLHLGRFR
jgi:hypothetical protein